MSTENELRGAVKENALIVVFGASGDLAKKMTFPSLFGLYKDGYLPPKTQIIGYARSKMESQEYIEKITSGIDLNNDAENASANDLSKKVEKFKKINQYVAGAYDEDDAFEKLEEKLKHISEKEHGGDSHRIFYLALPPSAFTDVSTMLYKHNHNGITNRLVIEKPFGKDTNSCQEMMGKIMEDWKEEEIYRIDHFLGEEMVKNIMYLRFGNDFIESMLNKEQVQSVMIELKEEFGTEGRGGYFDEFGMIRDVHQNHLLQCFALLTMEKPESLKGDHIRDEKVRLLKSVAPIDSKDLVLGQYTASGDKPSYTDDDTVKNKDSKTATYATVVLRVDNDRWRGVPFLLKSAKAVEEDKMRITVQFKPKTPALYSSGGPNELIIQKAPEEKIFMKINAKRPGMKEDVVRTDLGLTYSSRYEGATIPGAYEVVIRDVLQGDHTGFVREDELIAAWKIFTPLLKFIEGNDGPTPGKYKYGSTGPEGWQAFEEKQGLYVDDNGYFEGKTDLRQLQD